MKIAKRNGLIGLYLAILSTVSVTIDAEEKNGVDASEYKVTIEKKGDTTKIVTEGKSGYHCNTLYPWKLTIGEKQKERVYKKRDASEFSEKRVTFSIPKKEGTTGILKLSVCNDKQCIMKTETLKL